jgi:DGQHR domain-containing protein
MAKKTKRRTKKKRLSAEEKKKRRFITQHTNLSRSVFNNVGFIRVKLPSEERKRHFEFKGKGGELDDIFVFENLIVINENTTNQTSEVPKHLLNKNVLFDLIHSNKDEFLEFLEKIFPEFKTARNQFYPFSKCKLITLYSSRYDFEKKYKQRYQNVIFFDYAILRYFKEISAIIKRSARFELFKFLGLQLQDIGKEVLKPSGTILKPYEGSILPEDHSSFDKGFKVVSFYIDPESLLSSSYVLRKEGWIEEDGGYQRMFRKDKIKEMRQYLTNEKRVFVNNIIVTLPPETNLINEEGKTVEFEDFTQTSPVVIEIPQKFNCIGLIDGQHRVYSYHEGIDQYEKSIVPLRTMQNLLVTGIRYPKNISEIERKRFEAKLFLEINSKQSGARPDLKQTIELILTPFSSTAISKGVITRLAKKGPLESLLHEHFFDEGKIKTTTIVSYGLKPLVKLAGDDSLFKIWDNPMKSDLLNGVNLKLLDEYKAFCADELNKILVAVKINISQKGLWTAD